MSNFTFIYTNKEEFSELSKEAKYAEVLRFVKEFKTVPSTSNTGELERMLGQFLVNSKSFVKKGKGQEWEQNVIDEINTIAPTRLDNLSKIKLIADFCDQNNRMPLQTSTDANEKRLGQLTNTLKAMIKNGKFTSEEIDAFEALMQFKNKYQKSRIEKLDDILKFCIENDRTPRQHVEDDIEKRMAELLSTTKILHGKVGLSKPELDIFTKIMKFAPMSREEKLKELYKFINSSHSAPKLNSNDANERKMATFLSKMKSLMKQNKLEATELTYMHRIISKGSIKTRYDKIMDLHEFVIESNRHPKLNSDSEEERKQAMFFNNIKQTKKLDKLNADELTLLDTIESMYQVVDEALQSA